MNQYSQSRGEWTCADGTIFSGLYSGHDGVQCGDVVIDGINNPDAQRFHNCGPIPQGQYTISPAHDIPHLGSIVMALTPAPTNNMFGRSGFFIHGDNAQMNHTASDGCIIAGHDIRVAIDSRVVEQGDDQLTVVA